MSWKPEYPVCWHEGMFLLPAHFQMANRRNDFLMQKRFAAASPLAWGVVHKHFDESQLGAGIFQILELEAFFPDGGYVQYSSSEQHPLKQELDSLKATPNVWKTIWAILPLHSLKSPVDAEDKRYCQQECVLNDATTEEPTPIPVLVPNLDIVLGTPPAHCTSLPLAKVSFRAEGFRLDDYEPPQLTIKRDSPIFKLLEHLTGSLRNLANALIRRKEENSYDDRDRLETYSLLPGLIGQLPMLETLLFSESVHPLVLFGSLANVGGMLCSVGHVTIPRRIDYDHRDSLKSFTDLVHAIQEQVARTFPTYHREIPFDFDRESNRFSISSSKIPVGQVFVGVVPRPGADETKVSQWMSEAIIGYETEINTFSFRRTVGAGRQRQSGVSGVILYRQMQIWSLSPPNERLQDILFCIQGMSDTNKASQPVEIYLLVLEKDSLSGDTNNGGAA
ncbi:MAG: type VI secretion system baseplate subunit TssK [Planctomycetaceae bacterium]|nr:type VI secretion system baseplate subunit TssK [Planctomycetaceae bacterium]